MPALRRYAHALVKESQDQDDLVHDCLVHALTRLHTQRDDSSLRAWLFVIMHNLFISQWRHKRARGHTTILDETTVDASPLPPEQEHQTELRQTLRTLYTLPEEQRQVLVLVAIEALSYAEVAQILGIPLGTVMSRLSRGRERLRRIMEGLA
jgi:RNA polymerase sigma-70 factor (ECF subfamily)